MNRTRVEAILDQHKAIVFPGVYDTLSAKLAERAGFPMAFISGYSVAATSIGEPDLGLLTQTEIIDQARRVCGSVKIPIIVDADTGYGNPLNVARTVELWEQAGASGLFLEDQVWPKRCGHMAGKSVIPAEEMVQKVKAACDARNDPDFIIISRTDAAGTHGVDEAIRRLNLYAEAGADCLDADALLSKADIAKVAKNVPKPLIVNMGLGMRSRKTTPLMTPKELQDIGVKVISYPRLLTTAALQGMMNALKLFKDEVVDKNKLVSREDLQMSFEDLNDLMGMKQLDVMEEKYKGG
jgi:2-methylisocitrate lyase-like PEP mutase family enzyme